MEETIVPAPEPEAMSDASSKVEESEAAGPPRVRKIRKVLERNEHGEELTAEFDVKEDGTAQLVGFVVRKRKAAENAIELNGGERHQLKRTIKRRIVSKDLAQSIQNSASLVALLGEEVVSAAALRERWDNEGLAVVSTTQVRRSVMRLTPEQLARSAKAASSSAAAAKKARTSAATSSRSKAKVAKKEEVKDSDESDAASSADEADRTSSSSKSKRAQAAAKKKKESAKLAAKKTAKKETDKKRGSAASKKAKRTSVSSSSKKSKKDSDAAKKASSKSSSSSKKKRAREESDNEEGEAKAKGAKRSAKKKAKVEEDDDEGERPKPPPIPFSYIKKNMYLHRSMRHWSSDEVPVCNCRLVSGKKACGENCINRVLNIECKLKHCPCGTNCSNRQFQLRKYAKIDRFLTGKKGWGLRAREKIPKGTFIIEYVGEVISTDMCQDRMKYYEEMGLEHYYFLTLDGSECIDASQKGNLARFINHSCNPNAKTHKWTVDKEIRVGIFAEEDIPVGQEITFDYQFERFGGKKQKCFCGETNCRGFLGAKPKKLLHQRRKEYASRAIMGRPRDNVINPLTVEAVLEHALQFNPINKVKLDVLFPESDQQPSPALGAGPPMSPPLLATAVAQMSPAARSEFMSSLPPIVPVFLRRNAIRVHRQCFVKYHQLKGAVVVATQPDDASSSSLGSTRSSSAATTTATTAAKAKAAARRGGRASTGGRAKANGKSRSRATAKGKKKTKKESSSSSSSSSSDSSSESSSSSSSSSESSSSEGEEDEGAKKSASKSRRKKAVADSKKKKKTTTTTTKQKAGKSKRKATTTKARGTKAKAKKAVSESESESDEKKKVKEKKVEKEDVPDSEREEEQEEEEKAGKEDKRNDAEGSGGDKMEEEPKEDKMKAERPDGGGGGAQEQQETKEKDAGGDLEMATTTTTKEEGKGAGPQQDDNGEGDDDAALRGESGPEDEGVDNNNENKGDAMDVARTDIQ